MPYCTLAQLIERYGQTTLIQLTDRGEEPTDAIVESVVDRAIADADATIDGYLKRRYALPLAAVPPLLTDLSLKVSIYNLHAHVAEEKIRKDYEDALRMLREIGEGKVQLDVAGAEPAASGSEGVRTNEQPRPLTADSMKGFI